MGLNLPSILEETRVLNIHLEIILEYTCFHKEKCTRKSRLEQNVIFLLKNLVCSLWSITSVENLPTRFDGSWGAFCPLCTLNIRYCTMIVDAVRQVQLSLVS